MNGTRALAEKAFAAIPWRFPRGFGLPEFAVYLSGGSLDFVRRHAAIVNELQGLRRHAGRPLTVLDFGGANSPLSSFLRIYGLGGKFRVTVADIDAKAVGHARLMPPLVSAVVLDPEHGLPFDDGSFDAAVSSDVFEHIPRVARARWAAELHRVAPGAQIHNVPCDGDEFVSSDADREYQAWHVDRFGRPEPWTAEHMTNGVPTIEELKKLFPRAELRGIASARMWLESMKDEAEEPGFVARTRRGMVYALSRRRREAAGPFKACFVTEIAELPVGGRSDA